MKKNNALETGEGGKVRATGRRCYSFRIKRSQILSAGSK